MAIGRGILLNVCSLLLVSSQISTQCRLLPQHRITHTRIQPLHHARLPPQTPSRDKICILSSLQPYYDFHLNFDSCATVYMDRTGTEDAEDDDIAASGVPWPDQARRDTGGVDSTDAMQVRGTWKIIYRGCCMQCVMGLVISASVAPACIYAPTLSLQHSHFNTLTSTLSLQHSHFNTFTSTL